MNPLSLIPPLLLLCALVGCSKPESKSASTPYWLPTNGGARWINADGIQCGETYRDIDGNWEAWVSAESNRIHYYQDEQAAVNFVESRCRP